MSANPYAAPQARVQDQPLDASEVQPVKLWSSDGRIGRLRYVAYSWGGYFLMAFVAMLLVGAFAALKIEWLGGLLAVAVLIAYVLFSILLTIQRCHDVNWSGWWTLMSFIPLVNLIFLLMMWFMPGTNGRNQFGAPPPPNKGSGALVVVVILAVGVPVIGILAAIAIPQYQAYVQRAKAAGPAQ